MATINWTSLINGDVIPFDPLFDVFNFNDPAISAASVGIGGQTETLPHLTFFSFGGKTVTLEVNPLALTTTNVTFADAGGSMLLIGDNTTGTDNDHAPNTLVGGGGDDQLIGLGGADSLVGGDGNDVFAVFGDNAGVWGNDTIDGGNDIDRVIFPGDEGDGVNVDLGAGTALGGEFNTDTLSLISIEQVYGSMFADTLLGGSGNELFSGQAGSDSIAGGAGIDTLSYENSPARVIVNMFVNGQIILGADTVQPGTATDGFGGTDTISGFENVIGSAFNDSIRGAGSVANLLEGRAGNDTLLGGGMAETVAGAMDDTLLGGAGDDVLRQSRGHDVLDGGAGFNDRLEFGFSGINYGGAIGVSVNLGAGTSDLDPGGGDTVNGAGGDVASLSNIEQVFGTAGNDVLTGGGLSHSTSGNFLEVFRGGAGNDTIDGRGAGQGGPFGFLDRVEYNDSPAAVIVNLGTGTASDGFGGTDTLLNIDWVRGSNLGDTLVGGNPALDEFERFEGRGGNDFIDGGSGIDEASYQSATNPVNANLGLGTASDDGQGGTDTLVSIERLRGGSAGDVLTGSNNAGVVELFIGEGGNDTIDGGGGIDFASWQATALTEGGVNAFIENGSGTVTHPTMGTDTLINIEGLAGTNSSDTLAGGLGDQWFRGRGGSDALNGGAGIDTADYSTDPGAVTVNLATGTATDGWGDTWLVPHGNVLTLAIAGEGEIEFRRAVDPDSEIVGSWVASNAQGTIAITFLSDGTYMLAEDGDSVADPSGQDGMERGTYTWNGTDLTTVTTVNTNGEWGLSHDPADSAVLSNDDNTLTLHFPSDDANFVLTRVADPSNPLVGGWYKSGEDDDSNPAVLTILDAGSFLFAEAEIFADPADSDMERRTFSRDPVTGKFIVDALDAGDVDTNPDIGPSNLGHGIDTLDNIENAFGSSFSDSITGNGNANRFDGGRGTDTLTGGAGNDQFVFAVAPVAGNEKLVTDFQGGGDSIRLDASQLTGLAQNGALHPSRFVAGASPSATTADHRILYDTTTGDVSYDADGVGSAAAVKIFTLRLADAPAAVSATDFIVFNAAGTGTVHLWSTLTNNQVLAFNPGTDRLIFDDPAISAADVGIGGQSDTPPFLTFFSFGGKSITLEANPLALTTTSVTFANGTLLLIGDNTSNVPTPGSATFDDAPNALTGGSGNDQLIAVGGADNLAGLGGNDLFLVFGSAGVGRWGNDTINGGTGTDRISFPGDEGDGVNVNLGAGTALGGEFNTDTLTLISIEQVFGSMFADILLGGSGNDLFSGQAGSDSITGGAGIDTLSYENSPARVIVNMLGTNPVTVGPETVQAGTATDGFGGTDTISQMENVLGSAFNDFIIGNNSANLLEGRAGNDTLTGGGSNISTGDIANDTLLGGAGDDQLRQTRGADLMDGGDGFNDRLAFTNLSGSTTGITYGGGGAVGVLVNLGAGTSDYDTSDGLNPVGSIVNIEGVNGTAGNDVLTGGSLARSSSGTFLEFFRGLAGNDTIDGRGAGQGGALGFLDRVEYNDAATVTSVIANLGTNPISGNFYGTGDITVAGGTARDGTDSVTGGGTDTLLSIDWVVGGNFSDTLVGGNPAFDSLERFEGRGGNDFIDGGSGIDEASYQSAINPVNVDLGLGTASDDGQGGTDTLVSIERVRGGSAGDVLSGSNSAGVVELFIGEEGNDTIDGGAGLDFASWQTTAVTDGGVNAFIENGSGEVTHPAMGTDTLTNIEGLAGTNSSDTLAGGLGDQWFRGRGGSDILDGGEGIDTADYSTDPNGAIVNLGTAPVIVGTETVPGGAARDGWGGIWNLQGTDTLTSIENVRGSSFNDNVTGDAGANVLDGQGGNDTLDGGAGLDILSGGSGSDTFVYSAAPVAGNEKTVTDFVGHLQSGGDLVRLDASQLTGLTTNGTLDPSLFVQGAGIQAAQTAAERIAYNTTTGDVFYDADGSGGGAAVKILTLFESGTTPATVDASDFVAFNGVGNPTAPALVSQTLFGGAGNQLFHDVDYGLGRVYLAGEANNATNQSLAVAFAETNLNAPAWNRTWSTSGGSEGFFDVTVGTATADAVFAGWNFSNTFDGVGGKESKAVVVNFNPAGTSGPAVGGADWNVQADVNGNNAMYSYTGVELFLGVAASVEGGNTYYYTAGAAQPFSYGAMAVMKFDANGVRVAQAADPALGGSFSPGVPAGFSGGGSDAQDVTTLNGNVFVVGSTGWNHEGDAGGRPTLLKYDTNLTLLNPAGYKDTTLNGIFYGVTALGNELIAVGQKHNTSATSADYLIEKFDQNGVFLGGVSFGTAGEDSLRDVVAIGDRLFVTGYTNGEGAGGYDVVLMEINPTTGAVISQTLFGGAGDDKGFGLATDGSNLFVAGESRSFTLAGNLAGQSDGLLLNYAVTGGGDTQYLWSTLTDGQTLTFDPLVNSLRIDDPAISAADLAVDSNETTSAAIASFGGKTITLEVSPLALTTGNVTFADGSRLIIGDNTTGTLTDDGPNTLVGGSGDDQLIGLGGADSMTGGGGNDLFMMFPGNGGTLGNDTINGGTGTDSIRYSSEAGLGASVNLATGVATGGEDVPGSTLTLAGIENASGTGFNDTLTGNTGANLLEGRAGNDTLDGGGTTDTGNDTLLGGSGDDRLVQTKGSDLIDGGEGFDTLAFNDGVAGGVNVNLATHASAHGANVATLAAIEQVIGTAGNDTFTGGDPLHASDALGINNNSEVFRPLAGNDTIIGMAGNGLTTFVDYSTNTSLQPVNVNLGTGLASDGQAGSDRLVEVDGARGGAGNDTLTGGSQSRAANGTFLEIFRGGAGNDLINGNNNALPANSVNDRVEYNNSPAAVIVNLGATTVVGTVTVVGGTARDGFGGIDTLSNINQVRGSAFNDTLFGGAGGTALEGLAGNDSLVGGTGTGDEARYLNAPAGVIVNLGTTDQIVGSVTVTGGTAVDGFGGIDTLAGIERARGGDFDDRLFGGDGNERFIGGAGSDTIDGGAGTDFASWLSSVAPVNASVTNGSGTVTDPWGGTDTLISIEGLEGTSFNDTLTGGAGDQVLRGRGGSDSLTGGAGEDTASYNVDPFGVVVNLATGSATDGWGGVFGLQGNDTLSGIEHVEGSNSADSLTGDANANRLQGLSGNDTLDGGAGNDTLDGGTGTDTVAFSGGAATVNLGTNTVTDDGSGAADTLISIENVVGSANGDNIIGDVTANRLEGGAGLDTLDGGSGNDTLLGGAGNDRLLQSGGNDVIDGGDDIDTLVLDPIAIDGAIVNLATGVSTHGVNIAAVSSVENVEGSGGGDSITGNNSANALFGLGGDDTINGGAGLDTYEGGDGNDVFVFATAAIDVNAKVVNDFLGHLEAGGDVIRLDASLLVGLSGAGGIEGALNPDQFVSGAPPSAATTDAHILYNDTTGEVFYDADGLDGVAAVKILTLSGVPQVDASDFFVFNILPGAGTAGNDTFFGSAGNDTLNGGLGIDTVNYSGAPDPGGVIVNLGTVPATAQDGFGDTDTLIGIENIVASTFDDTIVGSIANNLFAGGSGNDSLSGATGNDTLDGGDGDDILVGGAGTDSMLGGAGEDLFLIGAATDFTVTERINGEGDFDTLRYTGNAAALLRLPNLVTNIEQVEIASAAGDPTGIAPINVDAAAVANALTIIGNDGNNMLTGTGGDDELFGNLGNDTLSGGAGDDRLDGGNGGNVYLIGAAAEHGELEVINGGEDNDVIRFTSTTTGQTLTLNAGLTGVEAVVIGSAAGVTIGATALSVNASAVLEGLAITGNAGANALTGTDFDDALTGNAGNDTLSGGDGNDTLNGGGGTDIQQGGSGDDIFLIGSVAEFTAAEVIDGGDNFDTLRYTGNVAATLALTANVTDIERVEIVSAAVTATISVNASAVTNALIIVGNDVANMLTGTGLGDVLTGNGGNDNLNGGAGDDTLDGGIGNDTLNGGAGDDTLLGGDGNDVILIAAAGEHGGLEIIDGGDGSDVIRFTSTTSGETLLLNAGLVDVESVVMTGLTALDVDASALTAGISITGNAGANTLFGTSAGDALNGGAGNDALIGGAGNDTLSGGLGNDSFFVDATTDVVTEGGGAGTDTVFSTATFVLGPNVNVENLLLTGDTDINATGNALNNVLTGNTGANILNGGIGNDTMLGGDGDDTYVVGAAGDVVTEAVDAGIDLVQSTVTYALSVNLENLTLTGAAAINGTGNGADNTITGNTGNNILSGGGGNDTLDGGTGNDTLTGGAGDDDLRAGDGNDVVLIASAAEYGAGESVDGGAGSDAIRFTSITAGDTLLFNAGVVDVESVVIGTAAGVTTGLTALNVDASALSDGLAITGNAGANTLNGTSGDDALNGGAGADNLLGGLGADTLNGGVGNDNLVGGDGADNQQGGLGDDLFQLATVAEFVLGELINGGGGNDALQLSGAGQTLDLTAVPNTAILGIERIDLTGTGNNTLTLNLADVLALSDTTDILRVDGNGDDTVNAGGGWTQIADVTIGANVYDRYTQGLATLLIDTDITQQM